MSDISDLEAGEIYGQEDVFDPENHAEVVRELTSEVSGRLRREKNRRNQRQLFKALGINVMRSLLTYLDVKDMMRFTTVCRWMYRFGNDAVVLAHFGAGREGGWSSRAEFIENERWKALISSKEGSLRKDVIFDPALVSVFHTEYLNFRLLFFSLYDSRIRIWECPVSDPKLLLVLPGLTNLIDSVVSPEIVIVMSESELLVTRGNWTSFQSEDRISHHFTFENRVNMGQVREVVKEKAIVTGRNCTITVFNEVLERVREFQWEKLLNMRDLSRFLLVPSNSLPFVVSVRPFIFVVYDIRKDQPGVVNKLTIGEITRADVISAQTGGKEQNYLLIQSVNNLYANGVLIGHRMDQFAVLKDRLVVHLPTGNIVIYKATLLELKKVEVLNQLSARINTLVLSARHYLGVQIDSKDSKLFFLSFDRAYSYTITINHMVVSTVFGSATDVVLLGNFINTSDKCVTIIRFNRGASKWSDDDVSHLHSEARRKFLMDAIEKLSAQQEVEMFVKRRVEWKETLADLLRKKEMRKTKWWKNKLTKIRKLIIIKEIQDAFYGPREVS